MHKNKILQNFATRYWQNLLPVAGLSLDSSTHPQFVTGSPNTNTNFLPPKTPILAKSISKTIEMRTHPKLILALSIFAIGCEAPITENKTAGKAQAKTQNPFVENLEILKEPSPSSPTIPGGSFPKTSNPMIAQLATVEAHKLDCGVKPYWKIVQQGKQIIPDLIESLTDTTGTQIFDYCKKGNLNIGEVAYFALNEIAEFPIATVTQNQFDTFEDGCWIFFDYLFDNQNKPRFKEKMESFYQKKTYQFVAFSKTELTECQKHFKIKGKYKLRN